ncbi:hypothetical protein QJS04_geneDACA022676 [Acorus gramineus]|uniref:F-box associated beta-propeller type 1 domain-containing protein n=1 Tax=Acorus gramineus TaxID=55184 RepID=A0AAV9BBI2_ACOGR|nr:hypothetical protein QJS04_geneDACA022676 [Acorus gramineus]
MIGIGYDNSTTSTTRKYKCLRVGIKRLTNIFDPNAIDPVKECHVCDINVDGTVGPWRSIGVFYNNKYDARFRGVTWNGGIHWLVYKRGRINIGRPRLASFCIEEEKFKTCKLPFCLREHSYDRVYNLLVLGGRLSIIDHSSTSLRMVIWMVKDDFVQHRYTWTKEYVIPFDEHPNMNESGFKVKCLWRDGEILMTKDDNSLVSYDTKKGTFQDVHIHGLKGIHYIEVYPFWKSFMLKRADDTKLEEIERKAKRLKINTQS